MAIGLNVFRYAGDVADALFQIRPPLIVTGGDVDWDIIRRCKALFDTVVLYRYMTPGNYDNVGIDAERLTRATLAAIAPARDAVDIVAAFNEVVQSDNLVAQAAQELAFARGMQAAGVPVCALNVGVGFIEPSQVVQLLDLWKEAAAIGCHPYLAPGVETVDHPENVWHMLRPERLWLPVLARYGQDLDRVWATEFGTYFSPYIPDAQGRRALTPDDYAQVLIACHERLSQGGIRHTAAFTLSGEGQWSNAGGDQPWELAGTSAVAVLAEYNRQRPSSPPPVRIPRPAARPGATSAQPSHGGGKVMTHPVSMVLGAGIKAKAEELGPAVTGKQLTGEVYLKDGQGKDTYSFALFEKCEIRYYPLINRVFVVPFQ